MALQTINTIQDPESYKAFIEKYFEDTLEDTLQALANSGNRLGVAGSSVQYHSYNIFDIIDDLHIDSENKSDYAIGFEYTGSQYRYQIYNLNTGSSVTGSEIKYVSENNTIDLIDDKNDTNSLYSSIKNKILMFFGHIDDISENSIIHKKNDILTCIFKCHIINTKLDDEYSAEYLYFQYNVKNNQLLNFLDIKSHNENYCIIYRLEQVENNDYKFDVHLFNIASLEEFIKDNFIENAAIDLQLKELFRFKPKDGYNEVEDSFSFLNSSFADYNVLCNVEYIYNASSIIQFILNHNSLANSEYDIIHSIEEQVEYDGETESMGFDIDNSIIVRQLSNRVSNDDIREFMWMASSINGLYSYLLDIYNSNYYVSSKKQLFINIIKALYSHIYDAYGNNSTSSVLYIPYNVKLNFLSSDINELKIMYMNNIDVIHWNGTDIELSKDHITYYDPNIENKITNYNVYIDYNDKLQDVINNIIVYKTYTYPYINKLNEWIINDINSGISSYNELLSLNKLVILYCNEFDVDNNTNYASYVLKLNNIADQDKKYFGDYTRNTFVVNSDYFPSYKTHTIKCNTLVPTITSLNKNYFENTILLIVTNKNNLIGDSGTNYATNYEGNYIYSLWKYSEENDDTNGEFVPIIDPESLEDINEKQYAFDPFGYKLASAYSSNNILYAQANNNKTAQNTNNLTGYDYIVLRNKLGEAYAKTYENNLNIIIECVNNLNKRGENPNYPDENGKYIQDTASVITSNTIYPKYQFEETNQYTITKYSKETQTIQELINNETIQLYAYYDSSENPTLVSQQYIEEVLQNRDVVKYIPQEETISKIVVGVSSTENYSEYVPDKQDVPTMDFKEVLNRNVNVLNRINILGVGYNNTQFTSDVENRWYNGFFGTYFDNNISKAILGISTNATNINVGTDTLFNLEQVKRFNTFDTFRIDGFNTIELKPTKNIITSKPIVNQETITSDFIIKSISCVPVGKMYKDGVNSIAINLDYNATSSRYEIHDNNELIKFAISSDNNYNIFDPIYPSTETVNQNLFIQCGTYKKTLGQDGNENLKSFKCLYLNNLIADKFGLDKTIIDTKILPQNITCGNGLLLCISSKNESSGAGIVSINDQFKNYFFMILANKNELDNLESDIYIYNHQLNMTMCKYGEKYSFNIKFDDTTLNNYDNNIVFDSTYIYDSSITPHYIEYYIQQYNNLINTL